jgi:hypothetical protein
VFGYIDAKEPKEIFRNYGRFFFWYTLCILRLLDFVNGRIGYAAEK